MFINFQFYHNDRKCHDFNRYIFDLNFKKLYVRQRNFSFDIYILDKNFVFTIKITSIEAYCHFLKSYSVSTVLFASTLKRKINDVVLKRIDVTVLMTALLRQNLKCL